MSSRAIEVLRSVDVIACEDTRHTRKLLTHFDISNSVISYHEHNEIERADELAARLQRGESVAIVSDAGTPGICDPSFRIVAKAREIGADVVPIPGAVAFVSAVVASGIATDSIFFGGFLPSKASDRRKRLAEIKDIPATLVFYETPHRLVRSLGDCREVLGDRHAAVARELTKLHEEIVTGTLGELIAQMSERTVRGEIVLVIERRSQAAETRIQADERTLGNRIEELQNEGLDAKAALKKAAKEFGLSRSEAYRMVMTK